MGVAELRAAWREANGCDAPAAFSKDLIARALAYEIQEQRLGGLSRRTAKMLAAISAKDAAPARRVKVGSVIVREHQGKVHEVMVAPGGFVWNGETYPSLSAIARKITGVSWSGPRFFGLAGADPALAQAPASASDDMASKRHGDSSSRYLSKPRAASAARDADATGAKPCGSPGRGAMAGASVVSVEPSTGEADVGGAKRRAGSRDVMTADATGFSNRVGRDAKVGVATPSGRGPARGADASGPDPSRSSEARWSDARPHKPARRAQAVKTEGAAP